MFVVELTAVLVTADRDPPASLGVVAPRGRDEPRVRRPDRRLAVVHRPVRDLRRGRRRGARPRPGGHAAAGPARSRSPTAATARRHARGRRQRRAPGRRRRASSARARRSRPTATSSRAWPTSTRPRSRASPRRSSRSPARTSARASPAAPRSSPTQLVDPRSRANPGETFLDRMIALVEGAQRQRTPNEIALSILLVGPHARVPAGDRHAPAVRRVRGRRGARSWRWSRCWSASSRPPSAACCPPSASRAWTASRGSTCSR